MHRFNTIASHVGGAATPTVTVCGGGNAAHVMVAHLGAMGVDVRVFASFGDEAARLEAGMRKHNGILMNGKVGRPTKVSKCAADVVPGSKYVFIPLPVFAHEAVLRDILPHMGDDSVVVVMPATGAFDWTADKVFKDLGKRVEVAGIAPLPYVCRTAKFGEEVNLMGVKPRVGMSCSKGTDSNAVATDVEKLLGFAIVHHPSFLSITLTPTNPIMHPARMYGMLAANRNWREHTPPFTKNVLFYDECDDVSNDWLHRLDNENQQIVRRLEELIPGVLGESVKPINEYLKWAYGPDITDHSSAGACFRTNKQFHGVGSPMMQVAPGYWVPDFKSRYFTEDIPFGLLTNKAIAELISVPTPNMDTVIEWMQNEMGKQWLVNGKVNPAETPQQTPQALGMTLDDLKRLYNQ